MRIPGYHIEREIGRGGMSIVYLAVQESLNRPVALKIMSPVLATDPQFAKRFVKEGVTVARLAHRGIIKVFDTGVYDNNYYLSMEYLPGGTLADRIKQGLSLKDGLAILRGVADALGHAHRAGVIHRDIKPQNILFYGDGAPVVTDFGIAKTYENATVMTATGLMVGSPNYMSPEQIKGAGVDNKSDLYALGIIFHEILTGKTPYSAPDSFALAIKHLNSPVPQLPTPLAHFQPVLEALLAKEAEQRCPSAEQLISALDQAERRTGAPPNTAKPGQSRAGLGLVAALALALLGGGSGAWWYYGQPVTAAEPATQAPKPQPPTNTGLLVVAREHLAAGHPELALERLDQALEKMPDDPEARALRRQAEQARQQQADTERERLAEAQRQAEERERLAEAQRQAEERERLAEAQRQAEERERLAEAQRQAEERERLAEAERQRLAEQERQDRLEVEQHRQQEAARRQLALEYQRLEDARRHLAEARRQMAVERERQQAARLAEQARQQQQEQRRQTQIDGILQQARQLRDQGNLTDSLTALDRGLADAPNDPQLLELRRSVSALLTAPEYALGLDQRRQVQQALTFLGYDTQGIDGLFGGNTRKAITAYQTANRLPRTGYLNTDQARELLGIAEQVTRQAEAREIPDSPALAEPQPTPEPLPVTPPKPVSQPEPEFSLVSAGESGGVRRRIVSRTVTELEAPPPQLVAEEQPLLPASADQPMTTAELNRLDDCWAQKGRQSAPSASILCVRQGQARVRVEEQDGVCQSYGPVRIEGLSLSFTARSSDSSPACRVETVRFHCTDIRQITMGCAVELYYPARTYDEASPRRSKARFVRAVNAASR